MMFLIKWDSEQPLYLQIRNQVVEALARGDIRPGDSLPSIRTLAEELAINLHTVHKAYQLLDQEGYIRLSRRNGGIVRDLAHPAQDFVEGWRDRLSTVLSEAFAQGMTSPEILQHCQQVTQEFSNKTHHQDEGEGVF
ncbi:MAG: GntR family transcriptional regulator [Sulfobacillus benefaciens]|uniref:GntR family transcriptional regulator n=1 Tax=Sulfobacillus benefaciens TaxID=453960 RepID=A0A2T2X8F9_9FIRM|nr:MAG: GntR family transcriptional regulator [Sulfobacillus benefaciens]